MKNRRILYIFFFLIIIITGCSKDESDNINVKEIVNDDLTINTLKNQVSILVNLDSIREGLSKDKFDTKNINDLDKIRYGVLYKTNQGGLQILDDNQLEEAKKYKINSKVEYIDISEINKYITSVFGPYNINYKSIYSCPKYIYNENKNIYYIDNNCKTYNNYTTIYIDEITKLNNNYYVNLYIGYIIDNKLYKDINNNHQISNNILEISESNKNNFNSYTFLFKKNSDGNYIFTNLEKNK